MNGIVTSPFAVRGRPPGCPLPADAGGKARGLERIVAAGLRTAPWFVVPAGARPLGAVTVDEPLAGRVAEACRRLTLDGAEGFAVRSSALDEDGGACSFAGQHLTVLSVPDVPGVLDAIGRCWASAGEASARAYRAAVGLSPESPGMAVIVQAMVKAECSGVAFSEAPDVDAPDFGRAGVAGPGVAAESPAAEGSREAVVVATRGLGAPLVSGEVNGDEYRVRFDGTVTVRRTDPGAFRLDARPGGGLVRSDASATTDRDWPEAGLADRPGPRCLDDEHVRAVADAARRLARLEGVPQDVEWAIKPGGVLCILQTRPVTAGVAARAGTGSRAMSGSGSRVLPGRGAPLESAPLPEIGDMVRLWDNANIVESFSGVTLPLTYSVAREAYASVYRGACRAFGVRDAVLDANADVFEQMIGHIEGRVYYNVSSWHRVLALLPGFGTSQPFLERMMGAARPGSREGERAAPVAAERPRALDLARVGLRCVAGLLLFERRARGFERQIGHLARESRTRDVDSMPIGRLLDCYEDVRARALAGWHVTIFNDMAVMLVHGALRRACDRWLDAGAGLIVNELLRSGEIASMAPGKELRRIALRLRDEPAWRALLDRSDDPLACLRSDPSLAGLRRLFEAYLDLWGDRCPSELQLDRPTFREEPGPVLSVIRALAAAPEAAPSRAPQLDRAAARDELAAVCLSGSSPARQARLRVLRWLIDMTRYRLCWRERMRFARTEVFAIGRRIFRCMDRRFVEAGIIERPGDLHYLDIAEIRGAIRGTIPPVDLRVIVKDRRARFGRFAAQPGPPSRFETAGPVLLARPGTRAAAAGGTAAGCTAAGSTDGAMELAGTPVWAGVVRGRCRPVEDPRGVTPRPDEIVVARSTDPGWVPVLLSAAGLLVERGSLLSHSAIVARELGLPTIVGIDGLMAAVGTGRMADMDGSSGVVHLEPVPGSQPAQSEDSR